LLTLKPSRDQSVMLYANIMLNIHIELNKISWWQILFLDIMNDLKTNTFIFIIFIPTEQCQCATHFSLKFLNQKQLVQSYKITQIFKLQLILTTILYKYIVYLLIFH